MTDVTIAHDNGDTSHVIELVQGNAQNSFLGFVFNSRLGQTDHDFQTPLIFAKDLYAIERGTKNNNVWVTVSGYFDKCPRKYYPPVLNDF